MLEFREGEERRKEEIYIVYRKKARKYVHECLFFTSKSLRGQKNDSEKDKRLSRNKETTVYTERRKYLI